MSDAMEADPPREEPDESSNTAAATKDKPLKKPTKPLPPWKVLLHNDDVNEFLFVIETVRMLTTLGKQEAELRVVEAHKTGVALLLTTHRERAELYQQQFTSRNVTVTIEPA